MDVVSWAVTVGTSIGVGFACGAYGYRRGYGDGAEGVKGANLIHEMDALLQKLIDIDHRAVVVHKDDAL